MLEPLDVLNYLSRAPEQIQFAHLKHCFFHQNKNHHLQGNVQVYNVRIPAKSLESLDVLVYLWQRGQWRGFLKTGHHEALILPDHERDPLCSRFPKDWELRLASLPRTAHR